MATPERKMTDEQVAGHVEKLRSLMPNQPGLMGAAPGAAATGHVPDHVLARMVKMPERPKGMPIAQWIKILAKILAMLQDVLPDNEPNTP